MTINVLGTPYTAKVCTDKEEPLLSENDGTCDDSVKEIFVADFSKHKDDTSEKKDLDHAQRKVMRHEIVHAFLCESGLAENSDWAQNEEMVDWIAIQGQKIYKAWQEAGAIDPGTLSVSVMLDGKAVAKGLDGGRHGKIGDD